MRDVFFLYALFAIIEATLTQGPVGHWGLTPHPYWLIILGMAAAHGTVAGLASVLAGVGIQILGLSPEMGLGGAIAVVVETPESSLLFLFGAFLVGEIHDAHERRFRGLESNLATSKDDATRLAYEREALLTALHRLRKRIEEQPVHLANLMESSARLQEGDADELHPLLLDLVETNCGAAKASVWTLESGGRLTLAAQRGWEDGERAQRMERYAGSDIVQFALTMRCQMKAFEFGSRAQAGDPLFVAPLERPDGELHGLLMIDEMPSRLVSPGAAAVFFGIAEWASTTWAVKGWGPDTGSAPEVRVRGSADLGERLRVEFDRVARYGAPLSAALVQVVGWRYSSRAATEELERALTAELAGYLEGRQLYRFGHPGCYVVILPGVVADPQAAPISLAQSPDAQVGLHLSSRLVGVDAHAPDVQTFVDTIDHTFRERAAQTFESTLPLLIPPRGELGDLDALLRRMRMEAVMARETGADCHLAIFHGVAPDGGRPQPSGTHDVLASLRPSDGLYWFEPDTLVLLMPHTSLANAGVAASRVLDTLRDGGAPELALIPEPEIVACEAEGLAPLSLLRLVEANR